MPKWLKLLLFGGMVALLIVLGYSYVAPSHQSDKIAEFAKPLTGNDVVKMLTSNEAQLRTRYQNYDKMLSRAREAGARPFFQGVSQEN